MNDADDAIAELLPRYASDMSTGGEVAFTLAKTNWRRRRMRDAYDAAALALFFYQKASEDHMADAARVTKWMASRFPDTGTLIELGDTYEKLEKVALARKAWRRAHTLARITGTQTALREASRRLSCQAPDQLYRDDIIDVAFANPSARRAIESLLEARQVALGHAMWADATSFLRAALMLAIRQDMRGDIRRLRRILMNEVLDAAGLRLIAQAYLATHDKIRGREIARHAKLAAAREGNTAELKRAKAIATKLR